MKTKRDFEIGFKINNGKNHGDEGEERAHDDDDDDDEYYGDGDNENGNDYTLRRHYYCLFSSLVMPLSKYL